MWKAVAAVAAFALLTAAGLTAATVITEYHAFSKTYTDRVTVQSKGKTNVYTVVGTVSGTITDQDTLPDPVIVTVTQPATTAEPPPTTTAPTTTQEEPPPPPPGNTLYLSPSGSDAADCKTPVSSCRSFARAYAVAVSPAVVEVAAGVYPPQWFAGDWRGTQAAGVKAITWHGQPGNAVRQIIFGSPNMTFDGINVDGTGANFNGAAAFENGGEPFTFRNAEIGNVTDQKGALVTGAGIVFDTVRFHDVRIATAGVHLECIFAAVPEGMVIRNSVFEGCDVMDVFFVWPDWWSPPPPAYGNVVLEGNQFGDPGGSCCGIYVGGTGPSGDRTMRNWTVRNNWFGDGPAIGSQQGGVYCGNTGAAPASWQVACS